MRSNTLANYRIYKHELHVGYVRVFSSLGLQLVINIHQEDYIQDIGDSAGLRLVIHNQRKMPFPEDEGVTVSPGHYTSIGIKQVETTKFHNVRKPLSQHELLIT